jgi:hypothetical protein
MGNIKTPYHKKHRTPNRNLVWSYAVTPTPGPLGTEAPRKLLRLHIDRHCRNDVGVRVWVREQTKCGYAEDSKNDDEHYCPVFLVLRQRVFVYRIGSPGRKKQGDKSYDRYQSSNYEKILKETNAKSQLCGI